MRNLFFIILLYNPSLFAQNYYPTVKTNFNKFIEKSNIEWAIYRNDTLETSDPDLRNILLLKVKEKKIKNFASVFSGDINENNFRIKKSNYEINDLNDNHSMPMFDSLGNEISSVIVLVTDPGPLGVVNLYQILYVENGKLLSYTSRVSPLKNIITPSGNFLGSGEYFSTALNINPATKKSKKDKIIFLKTTTTTIAVDSINKNDRLKETFGHNLIETLWPYIISGKIPLYNPNTNNSTTLAQINDHNGLNLPTVSVPIYDSLGNFQNSKNIYSEINAHYFDKIALTQQWYYNDTKNIVYCLIPEAFLFLKKTDYEASTKDLKPALKISF